MHEDGPQEDSQKKKNYVKKPLNAFMLFMKEERQKVVKECTLKESAAINQILGRKVRRKSSFFWCIFSYTKTAYLEYIYVQGPSLKMLF